MIQRTSFNVLLVQTTGARGARSQCFIPILDSLVATTGLFAQHYNLTIHRNTCCLLNADTIVLPNAFKALVDFMDEHPEVGIAGSYQEEKDGSPLTAAFRFPSPLSEFESALKLGIVSRALKGWVVAQPQSDVPCETDWLSGASMFVRKKVFDDIGVLDEGYFTFFEDVDFCFNARKEGWPVWYVPQSRIIHLVGQSTGLTVKKPKRLPSYSFEARRRYFLKNSGALGAALADFGKISGLLLWRSSYPARKVEFHAAPLSS